MRLNPDTCLDRCLLLCFPHFCVDCFLLAIVRIADMMSIVNVAENLMFCKSVILLFFFFFLLLCTSDLSEVHKSALCSFICFWAFLVLCQWCLEKLSVRVCCCMRSVMTVCHYSGLYLSSRVGFLASSALHCRANPNDQGYFSCMRQKQNDVKMTHFLWDVSTWAKRWVTGVVSV